MSWWASNPMAAGIEDRGAPDGAVAGGWLPVPVSWILATSYKLLATRYKLLDFLGGRGAPDECEALCFPQGPWPHGLYSGNQKRGKTVVSIRTEDYSPAEREDHKQ